MNNPINPHISIFIESELKLYNEAIEIKNFTKAFSHLERIHVISQSHPREHTMTHFRMLRFAVLTFSPLEILIQTLYSAVSYIATVLKLYPDGNTGGASAITKGKMEIPEDIQLILKK
jgi:hypothetical protein